MKTRGLLLLLPLLMITMAATAQTRKIGHRSHSGSPASFAMLMDDDHLGMPSGGFPKMLPTVSEVYHLEPWIDSLQRHFDANSAGKGQRSPGDIGPSTVPNDESPAEPDSTARSKKPNRNNRNQKELGQVNDEVDPDGGSAEAVSLAISTPGIGNGSMGGNTLWLLFAFLLFPVAPMVFWLSVIWGNQSKVA